MIYRITHARFDVPEATWSQFEAVSDEDALEKFAAAEKEPSLQWDHLKLICVTQVEETKVIKVVKRP